MHVHELLEAEQDGQAEREEAHRVHTVITEWLGLHQVALDELLQPSPIFGGSYIPPLRRVPGLSAYKDLLIAFAPPGDKSGMGTLKDGRKIIVINKALLAPSNLRHLPTRFGTGGKARFVHEFSHYLLDGRSSERSDSAAAYDGGDTASHYNHPSELQAYYQEATNNLWRTAEAIAPHRPERYMSMTTTEWVRYALNQHFDPSFIEHLTPENLQRIKKRLARFIEQTIQPIFGRAQST